MPKPKGRSIYLTADQQRIIVHALDAALAGEWGDGDFTFDDDEEAARMLAAANAVLDKLNERTP